MKTISKITLGLATTALLIVGCGEANNATPANTTRVKPIINEESLGLRKTDLYSEKRETVGVKTAHTTNAAGSGIFIDRAFQDAPPMVPHSVEGMIPITFKDNQCVACHAPAVAESMGATPYPASHMTNFRPDSMAIGHTNTTSADLKDISIKKSAKLVGARFNCQLCHAPQGEGQLVENTFQPDFTTSKDGAHRSNWKGTKLMEGINTIDGI